MKSTTGYVGLTISILLSSSGLTTANETTLEQAPVASKSAAAIKMSENAPVQIIISRKDQSLRVFRGNQEIAKSKVSTGKRGHTTPTGIFSILEKRKRHFSNIYNSAPMPYMQRLTWSGIALHESNSVPSYPASHGCVRLPRGFAKKLFSLTERGAHVIIANRDATPQQIQHQMLFQPQEVDVSDKLSGLDPSLMNPVQGLGKITLLSDRPAQDDVAHLVAKRMNQFNEIKKSKKPLRIFITRQARGNLVREIQVTLNTLGFDAGTPDGRVGKATNAAVRAFLASKQGSIEARMYGTAPRINQALLDQLYQAAGKGKVPTGHLFVRHNFKPLFDAPIQISNPDTPLGAHLFTASASDVNEGQLDWLAVNLGDKFSQDLQSRLGVKQAKEDTGIVASTDVLNRITIPDNVRAQINHLIKIGASLTISDRGFSRETTDVGTDFIVLTKPSIPTRAVAKTKNTVKRKAVAARNSATERKVAAQKAKKSAKPKTQTIFSFFKKKKSSS
ncbi:L,D-transpeptidase [Cohaesibacter celericrescens]|uniref:L,D-transpeptidase n=1 Tax=Cohaesibacter celericrescens TaxID=2067669 RepID=UPI00356881A4